MFVPRLGQRLLMAIALGLILSSSVTWGATIIPAPFITDPSLLNPPQPPYTSPIPSLSVLGTPTAPGSISIAHTGTVPGATYQGVFDLKNNDLIIQTNTEAAALSTLQNVTDMARSGYDSGDWAGLGVTSSTANFDVTNGASPGLTAIGVILNDAGDMVNPDGSGTPLYSTFDGKAVDQYAVLVKYTLLGDTDLSGVVDGLDVATVKSGKLAHATGWVNGEFQYGGSVGGVVDGADVSFVKTSIIQQHNYPFTVPGAQASSLSVPEPGSLSLAALGLLGLAGGAVVRRRKK